MQGAGDGGDGSGHYAGTAKRRQCRALVTAAMAQGTALERKRGCSAGRW